VQIGCPVSRFAQHARQPEMPPSINQDRIGRADITFSRDDVPPSFPGYPPRGLSVCSTTAAPSISQTSGSARSDPGWRLSSAGGALNPPRGAFFPEANFRTPETDFRKGARSVLFYGSGLPQRCAPRVVLRKWTSAKVHAPCCFTETDFCKGAHPVLFFGSGLLQRCTPRVVLRKWTSAIQSLASVGNGAHRPRHRTQPLRKFILFRSCDHQSLLGSGHAHVVKCRVISER
jgi:hypothetical protein